MPRKKVLHLHFWDDIVFPRIRATVQKLSKYLYAMDLGGSHFMRENRGRYNLRSEKASPDFNEIDSADALRDPSQVATDLRAIDWAFTSDDTGFLTHDLHPYPAKFIPQIPGHCIARLSLPGELVLDPFGGSGTTALEAMRLGRRALSIDANAVATLIGTVKTCNLDRLAISDLHAIRSAIETRLVELPPAKTLRDENAEYIPNIPNLEKWFPLSSCSELGMIKARIAKMESDKARSVSLLALSRIILAVSFQDSETRYTSKPRDIPQGEGLRRFLGALDEIVRDIMKTQPNLRYGVSKFITADTRELEHGLCKTDSVDLVVTSPPYGNANDYHLYHRFRLLWLGYDPRELAKIEIGSHLRHQKEESGFDSYLNEMRQSLKGMYRVLKPGRYAVLVVGDSLYKKVLYDNAESFSETARLVGFETVCIINRKIHITKRSFISAGRRATTEKLLVLRKPPTRVVARLQAPTYKLWPYEIALRAREIETILDVKVKKKNVQAISVELESYIVPKARRLVFTHAFGLSASDREPTWQAILENGFSRQLSARKDPKYVTHGLHPYKGKFYPQLAKGLINLCGLRRGAKILDPFCGSGTTLLEGYLNGLQAFGCDMNPLAAKIAKAKVGILDIDPDLVREAVRTLVNKIEVTPIKLRAESEQFAESCLEEIRRWFPVPVMAKLNWLLRLIRSVSEGVIRDFLEVVLSSIIRNVSQQDPTDLRIRKRQEPLKDADVLGLYLDALATQYKRIERFWSIRGYSPNRFVPCRVIDGDSRERKTFDQLGVTADDIDLILTSPPYATALPYIDTDRLSILVLLGMDSSARRPIEQNLIGSREIITRKKKQLESALAADEALLPNSIRVYLLDLQKRVNQADVGFRRKNMPALLFRFFQDMGAVLANCARTLRPRAEAMIVVGDNRTQVAGDVERIATTDFVQEIALANDLELVERIDISVTKENLVHIKNAITKNVVLRFRRSSNVGMTQT